MDMDEKQARNLTKYGDTVSLKSLQDSLPKEKLQIKLYSRRLKLVLKTYQDFENLPDKEQTTDRLVEINKKLKRDIQKLKYALSPAGQAANYRSSIKYLNKKK